MTSFEEIVIRQADIVLAKLTAAEGIGLVQNEVSRENLRK